MTELSRQAFGHAVRTAREEQGLTLEELGNRAEMHFTYLSGLERAGRNPTLAVLIRLAEALGMDLSELVARAEREGDPASRPGRYRRGLPPPSAPRGRCR